MSDPKRALLFLQDLQTEPIGPFLDSGIVFLLDNEETDWYVFGKTAESLPQQDVAHIEVLVGERGSRSEYSFSELITHPNKAFMSSGTVEQITDSLEALGAMQRFRAKAPLN